MVFQLLYPIQFKASNISETGLYFIYTKPFRHKSLEDNSTMPVTGSVRYPESQPTGTIEQKPIKNNFKAIERDSNNNDWLLIVFLVIFLIFAWTRINHGKRINQIFNAFFSRTSVNHIINENDPLMSMASTAINIIALLSFTLFICQAYLFYSGNFFFYGDWANIQFFFFVLISLFAIYLIKTLVLHLTGFIFKAKEPFHEYIFNVLLTGKILGVSLLPIVICLAYLPYIEEFLLKLGFGLIVIIYVHRLIRGLLIGNSVAKLSRFYLFLYLCTLEILPLIVFIKTFISYL